LDGLERATSEQQQAALDLVNEFSKNEESKTVWTGINKEDFVSSLVALLNDPSKIDQAQSNLCGIAVSCKASIEHDPEKFALMAISIYENGRFDDYVANKEMYGKKPSKGLTEALYITMSTLRHSLNASLPYYPDWDSGLQGFTYPADIRHILENTMNMKETTDSDFGSYGNIDPDNFKDNMIKAINANHTVILTVNLARFMGTSSWSIQPNHMLQVTGLSQNADGTLNVKWWSWGTQRPDVKMTKTQLFQSAYFYDSFE
jgi:hypothetical protein